jgi:hypothetical protein
VVQIQWGPIDKWPGTLRQSGQRIRAPFKSSYSSTLTIIDRELRAVSAESVICKLALPPGQFTIEGRPYVNARPDHPGVVLAFTKRIKTATGPRRIPLNFPCDRFVTWESNLRAIGLALEALRKVDRYGVTQNAEQYTGFKALPPAGPTHEAILTVDEAARFVASGVSGCVPADVLAHPENYRRAYREKAAALHPDHNAGQQLVSWGMLQAAANLLDAHHGL